MPTAFVTGATGFVGTNLVHELLAAGWSVTVLHRPTSDLRRLRELPIGFESGSIDDEDSLYRAIPRAVDAVFHVAANTTLWRRREEQQMRENVIGTRNVARAALRRNAARLIHTSSIAAFGHHHGRIDESTQSNALSSPIGYVRSKYLAELEIENAVAAGLDAVMINPGHIVGPWDDSNWSRMFRLVADGRLPGVPPGRGSFCHVREVARAHIAAVRGGRTGQRYLLGGADASFVDVVRIVGELTGCNVPSRAAPPLLLKLVGGWNEIVALFSGREPDLTRQGATIVSEQVLCNPSKAEHELGYRAVPLREMLLHCYRWMVSEGLLPVGPGMGA
jgi:dihydroflavonol-4-reductase